LGVIVGNLDLASERLATTPGLLGPIRAAIEGAEHGAELTKRLLAFSRQTGAPLKRIDLNDLSRKSPRCCVELWRARSPFGVGQVRGCGRA